MYRLIRTNRFLILQEDIKDVPRPGGGSKDLSEMWKVGMIPT
ncbi:MAG: hypothetical protein AAF587_23585 [Bacteroidota bacterium]